MTEGKSVSRSVIQGAVWGAIAWTAYGMVEVILSTTIQLWHFSEMEVLRWQRRWIAIFIAAYAVGGMLLGAVGGFLLGLKRDQSEENCQIFALWTVAVAFAANLVRAWPLARSEQIVLLVAVALIGGFSAALFSLTWVKRIRFLAGPWIIALLLLGVLCLSREVLTPQDSSLFKVGGSLVLLFVIVALAAVWNAFRKSRARTLQAQLVFFGVLAIAVQAARRAPVMNIKAAASAGKPNIALIVMDTVRADHTSLYGYQRDTTPNLRRFADSATLYANAIAASDFTLATHATMFTGLYPDWNGAIQSTSSIAAPLGAQHATLAELLGSMGYWTVESAANYGFLAPWTGLTRGFAVSDLKRPVTLSSSERPFYLREAVKRLLSLALNTGALDRPSRIATDINRRTTTRREPARSPSFPMANGLGANRTNWVGMGVLVNLGESRVSMRFVQPGYRTGLVLSLVSLVYWSALALWFQTRERQAEGV